MNSNTVSQREEIEAANCIIIYGIFLVTAEIDYALLHRNLTYMLHVPVPGDRPMSIMT
jgi:hypothetical protein